MLSKAIKESKDDSNPLLFLFFCFFFWSRTATFHLLNNATQLKKESARCMLHSPGLVFFFFSFVFLKPSGSCFSLSGTVPCAEYTIYLASLARKQGSITFLTSAAIFHLDTCAIQLAALTLLACPPPALLSPCDVNLLMLHCIYFL